MKKKYTKKQLLQIEQEMRDPHRWEPAHHTVSYKGPVSIRFTNTTLRKLHHIAQMRRKPISSLVNEFVKPLVDSEFALLHRVK